MEKKDKINFDLDFLEKNTKEKPKEQPKSKDPNWVYHKDSVDAKGPSKNPPPSSGMSDSAKKWAWGIGIILLFVIIGAFSDDNSSPSTSSNSVQSSANSGQVQVGHYMCSSYAASHAESINPSSETLTSLNVESDRIEAMSAVRKKEKADLDSTNVDKTNQYEIDSYNERVKEYNDSYKSYSDAFDAYEEKKNAYNNSVDTYNSYLESNCTPN